LAPAAPAKGGGPDSGRGPRYTETALIWPLQQILGHDDMFGLLRARALAAAQQMAAQLVSRDDRLAVQTAIDLAAAIFPGGAGIPVGWWGTPLGRLMVQTAGHPTAEAVSFGVAAAMLQVSKGRVQQLVDRGTLDRHPDGGVTSASVRLRALKSNSETPRNR
jgi:hypothetical protein